MSTKSKLILEREIGILSNYNKYDKVFSVTSYNNNEKYDVRTWDKDRQIPRKGINFDHEELLILKEIIKDLLLSRGLL